MKSSIILLTVAVLVMANGAVGAALVNVDSNVAVDPAFQAGLIAHDTFTSPNSAVGLGKVWFGPGDLRDQWASLGDYVPGNGGTVYNPNPGSSSETKRDLSAGTFNFGSTPDDTFYFLTVMMDSSSAVTNIQYVGLLYNNWNTVVSIGTWNYNANWQAWTSVDGKYDPDSDSGVAANDSQYHILLAKLAYTNTSLADVTVWLDPDLSLAEANPANTPFYNVSNACLYGFNQVWLEDGTADGEAIGFDYFGLSTGSPFVVPEPATLALLTLGSLGLAALRRRRRRR